jgi:hypothetical protein
VLATRKGQPGYIAWLFSPNVSAAQGGALAIVVWGEYMLLVGTVSNGGVCNSCIGGCSERVIEETLLALRIPVSK